MSQLSYKEIIENQLPEDLFKSKDIESQAIGKSLDKVQKDVDDLEKEVNPITAISKGLVQWERFSKLPSNAEDSIEIRKARVVAELIQFMTDENVIRKDEMEAILSFFGQVEITEHFAEYMFNVIFKDYKNLDVDEIGKIIKKIKPSWLDYRLTSEHSKQLQLCTNHIEYPIPYNMCGAFLCGTKPYIQNEGISFNTRLNANTNKTNISQRYPMTGTFKGGEMKL